MHQRGLAGAGDAGDRNQHSERNFQVDALQVVGAGAGDANLLRAGLAALRRNLNVQFVGEIASGERVRELLDFFVGSRADDFAAAFAGARAEIENVVGGAHDVGIVLDDENGVSQVAQAVQDLDQPVGVAAVQADGRLVEHVERADQTRAERGCQLDALRFAAGERRGEAIEREVFEADVVQEAQALLNFGEQNFGDGGLLRRELDLIEEARRLLRPSCCRPGRCPCRRS